MDEKKRSDTYQADCVTQKPTHRGRPVFTPGNAVIGDQGYDTKNRCSCCRGRAQHNVADHIPTATQPQIDLRGPAQYVGCLLYTSGLDTRAFPFTGASLTDIRFLSQWRADWQGWF